MEYHGLHGLRPPSYQRDCGLRTGQRKTSPDHRTSLELGEKGDYASFSKEVNTSISAAPCNIANASLDSRMSFLNDAILLAANLHIGKVKATTNDKEWMSRDIRDAIKVRNRLRRDITSNRTEWVTACRNV